MCEVHRYRKVSPCARSGDRCCSSRRFVQVLLACETPTAGVFFSSANKSISRRADFFPSLRPDIVRYVGGFAGDRCLR